MKKLVMTLFFMMATTQASADELIQFNDGSTGWRGENGNVWGKTPSSSHNFDSNDSSNSWQKNNRTPIVDQHGTVYAPAGSGYVNTQNGQFIPGR
jgi:hypothetical protein